MLFTSPVSSSNLLPELSEKLLSEHLIQKLTNSSIPVSYGLHGIRRLSRRQQVTPPGEAHQTSCFKEFSLFSGVSCTRVQVQI